MAQVSIFRSCNNSFGFQGRGGLRGIASILPRMARRAAGGSPQNIPVVVRKKSDPITHCIQYTEADLDPYAIGDRQKIAGYVRLLGYRVKTLEMIFQALSIASSRRAQ